MRRLILAACFTAGMTTLGCSSDPSSSGPDATLPDGSAVDADAAAGDEPEASPDVLADSEAGPDTGDSAEPDAGDCDGYAAKAFCDVTRV